MNVLEVDAEGNRRVRFRPTPADETEKAMEQLELAYFIESYRKKAYFNLKRACT